MKKLLPFLQQLGRALMLPIAVLPVAGLLLRLGQPDLLALPFIAGAGDAIFSNLGILFAIGVAVGLARENNGAAALAAVVGYFVATKGAEVLIQVPLDLVSPGDVHAGLVQAAYKSREIAKLSVPIGILSGLIAGYLYNRYSAIKLPSYLAFFAGRRFVPIASGLVGLVLAVVFGLGWPVIEQGMDQLSYAVAESGKAGLFVYGVLNRFLIATGLHHILNNVAWFIIGDFNGATGDLKRFFAGDPSAGAFMSGFFPVMMFGLPAACLAMYHTALPERKKETAGLLLSMALTSFLTGVTEPIEFTFMFLAPLLFALHAILTGTAMVVMDLLQTRLGFGFSAGLFDYLLNYKLAENPLMLIPVGAAYFALYYGLFRFFIQRFNILTPGRDVLVQNTPSVSAAKDDASTAIAFIRALGGPDNLQSVDACTTRLRLQVASLAAVNEPELKSLGAIGIVSLGQHGLQVVLGPVADQVAGEIRAQWQAQAKSPVMDAGGQPLPETCQLPEAFERALGGKTNIISTRVAAGRIMVDLVHADRIDTAALQCLGVKAHGQSGQGTVHLLHDEAMKLCGP
jgi:PTS system N-acetylglucosamine-specific IIC component